MKDQFDGIIFPASYFQNIGKGFAQGVGDREEDALLFRTGLRLDDAVNPVLNVLWETFMPNDDSCTF